MSEKKGPPSILTEAENVNPTLNPQMEERQDFEIKNHSEIHVPPH